MFPQPVNTPKPAVTIEYDCRGERTTKTFKCAYAGRRFYTSKFKSGHNPHIVATPSQETTTG